MASGKGRYCGVSLCHELVLQHSCDRIEQSNLKHSAGMLKTCKRGLFRFTGTYGNLDSRHERKDIMCHQPGSPRHLRESLLPVQEAISDTSSKGPCKVLVSCA